MKITDLKERTMVFSDRIMNMVELLPETKSINVIVNQILRSSSSVGANYRAARRAKSQRDFLNKLKIVEEEVDETSYWLELLERRKIGPQEEIKSLLNEANELVAIFVTSINTTRSNLALQTKK